MLSFFVFAVFGIRLFLEGRSYYIYLEDRRKYFSRMRYFILSSSNFEEFTDLFYEGGATQLRAGFEKWDRTLRRKRESTAKKIFSSCRQLKKYLAEDLTHGILPLIFASAIVFAIGYLLYSL